jgi:ABC-type transporter Mla MlaB component
VAAFERSRGTRLRALQIPGDPNVVVFLIAGAIERGAIPVMCEHLRGVLERNSAEVVVCDVGGIAEPDAATVDALSCLQLTARRLGGRVLLRHASLALLEIIDLMGLADVVPVCEDSGVESRRQVEEREEVRRVEKERDAGDPAS